jgi:hypothetical protein
MDQLKHLIEVWTSYAQGLTGSIGALAFVCAFIWIYPSTDHRPTASLADFRVGVAIARVGIGRNPRSRTESPVSAASESSYPSRTACAAPDTFRCRGISQGKGSCTRLQ